MISEVSCIIAPGLFQSLTPPTFIPQYDVPWPTVDDFEDNTVEGWQSTGPLAVTQCAGFGRILGQ